MITRLRIRNFKGIDEINIELGKNVVFVGPNNSGKTTALQALALWATGVEIWSARRREGAKVNTGIAINRRDLISIPIPDTNLLWRNLRTRSGKEVVYMDIIVDGVTDDDAWSCGMTFYHANSESFYCHPITENGTDSISISAQALKAKVAFLQPMSGLAAIEPRHEQGRINVLIGEGQTAQVLRNLCYRLYIDYDLVSEFGERVGGTDWEKLVASMKALFGIILDPPEYEQVRGEITMSYCNPQNPKIHLDISSAGKGLQQTLLLLAYLYLHRDSVLLLDEPDAHLEVLRQRQIYTRLTDAAQESRSQIIAASHSEIILNEAADRDIVIAFVGKPHRIDDRGKSQVYKALKEIGFDQYYQAEEQGWVLYLEGSTDLEILRKFAVQLSHDAADFLDRVFVHYIGNQPSKAQRHFYGLKEAKTDFVGIAILDHLDSTLTLEGNLHMTMWRRNEIENYLCSKKVLVAYASQTTMPDDLFSSAERAKRENVMSEEIEKLETALQTLGDPSPWSPDLKVTDRFLDPLFANYFKRLNLPNLLRKTDYHILVDYVSPADVDPEVIEKLDAIVKVAGNAKPRID